MEWNWNSTMVDEKQRHCFFLIFRPLSRDHGLSANIRKNKNTLVFNLP